MNRSATPTILIWLALAVPSLAFSERTEEVGIDRSNLTRESEAVQEKTLRDISSLHATWFRDVLSGTTPEGVAKFVNEVRAAKQNNLKFLANVLPLRSDYDDGYQNPNAGEDFRKRCGWTQGSPQISRINQAKLVQRLRMQFDGVKAANLVIDAFEIGNEADWICFNGDVPDGHAPTEAELMTAVRGYAYFLKTAAEVIHDPRYFPNARIITFGIAHGSDRWDRPPHHFSNPARMIAMLRNLDGFNYLDNTLYHIDGYGTHIYPDPDKLGQSVTNLVRQDAAILGPDKPFWITEWGVAANKYPNKQGQTRGQAFKDFYATLDMLHVPFGPVFYYAHSPGGSSLIDANGALLPEAKALALGGEHSIAPLPEQTGGTDVKATTVVVGVNIWNEQFLSKADQDRELEQMAASGVKVIRTGLVDYNMEFIIKAYQHGISTVAIVFPFPGSKTWSDVILSKITAEEFTAKFKPQLEKLETAGVRLGAFELGNEINTSRFNGDLPNPGSGRELRLADLNNPKDPEASAVARGYRAYVQVMAALKDLRDHSKLNQHTPILSAGLAQKLGTKQVEVNLRDSIEFFRQNGIDKLVDGYGIHVYPSADLKRPVSARITSLDEDMFSACREGGKPCWVTEWGFGNSDESCPAVEGTRVKLVQDMRSAFQHFATQELLKGLIYYDWTEQPGKPDSWAIFRCGALTGAGKVALGPM